jgi:kynurenine formamidase
LPDFIIKSAVVIEVKKEKPDEITLDEVELKSSGLKRGMCILISTGWERFYGKEEYLIHPYLSINLAKWLVKHGIEVIGIDTPSIDHPFLKRKEIEKLPVHDILLENKVLIIENLKSLEKMARKNIGLCIILKRGGKRRSINAAHIMSITPKV